MKCHCGEHWRLLHGWCRPISKSLACLKDISVDTDTQQKQMCHWLSHTSAMSPFQPGPRLLFASKTHYGVSPELSCHQAWSVPLFAALFLFALNEWIHQASLEFHPERLVYQTRISRNRLAETWRVFTNSNNARCTCGRRQRVVTWRVIYLWHSWLSVTREQASLKLSLCNPGTINCGRWRRWKLSPLVSRRPS